MDRTDGKRSPRAGACLALPAAYDRSPIARSRARAVVARDRYRRRTDDVGVGSPNAANWLERTVSSTSSASPCDTRQGHATCGVMSRRASSLVTAFVWSRPRRSGTRPRAAYRARTCVARVGRRTSLSPGELRTEQPREQIDERTVVASVDRDHPIRSEKVGGAVVGDGRA